MPLESHSLSKEFPEYKEKITKLKTTDNHFMKLFETYDQLEHEVHRIEAGAEAASDDRLEQLKKLRLHVKDELFQILKKTA